MLVERIAELLGPFLDPASGQRLTSDDLVRVSIYLDLLLRWNARINLTAVRHSEDIVQRHFGESFFLARHLFPAPSGNCHPEPSQGPRRARPSGDGVGSRGSRDPLPTEPLAAAVPRVIDLGSGAGFPALPLKIWNPGIGLVLVESNHKKVAFLREVTRALTLTNVDIISERAESLLPSLGPAFPPADVVTFRAVERFNQILPTATALLSSAPGSRLAVLVGSAQLSSTTALPNLGWTTFPLPNAGSRVLSIGVRQ